MKDFIDQIIKFNHDKNIIALKERYQQPSFFEIISKSRSETTYSAFLKWLFLLNCHKPDTISPIALLLDLLIQEEGNNIHNSTEELKKFKFNLLSRNIKISNVTVETEKSVGEIASGILKNTEITETPKNILEQAKKSKDRIDIFISCDVKVKNNPVEEEKEEKEEKLQIIIENKIDAGEGDAKNKGKKRDSYQGLSQTERYYQATRRDDIIQYYVFLTPVDKEDKPVEDNFIHITYQDILEDVIMPLLNSSSVTSKERILLEEFKNELLFPNIENINDRVVIARSNEKADEMSSCWQSHKELIVTSLLSKINREERDESNKMSFWKLDKRYFNTFPREEVKAKLNTCHALEGKSKNPNTNTLETLATDNGINLTEIKAPEDENEKDLLWGFYNENEDFLIALMDSIGAKEKKGQKKNKDKEKHNDGEEKQNDEEEKKKDEEKKEVEGFLDYMKSTSKKGRRKYSIYLGDELHGEPYIKGNWNIVFNLVKILIDYNKNIFEGKSSDEVIEILNKKFTVDKVSGYYWNRKILKYLFYKFEEEGGAYHYDGSNVDGKDSEDCIITGFDMLPPGQGPCLEIYDTRIAMARMWRKGDVDKFIKYITKEMKSDKGWKKPELHVEIFS